jgi:alpha-galactosidase
MKNPAGTVSLLLAVLMAANSWSLAAKDIPAQLPDPDGKAGDATKPVKVYILAGQSNMVGMGDISGARPPYPKAFLSADPAIIPGVMPIGSVDDGRAQDWVPVARHGVFEAKAAVYPGPGETTKQPVKTVAVALGTVAENLPATEGTRTVVVTALIDVPATGNYTVHAGFGDSTHSVVSLDGKEVYRKDIGGKPVITKVALETGKRYPVAITYFKGGSAAFWLEQVEIEGKGDLVTLTKKDKKFPYLLDDAGKWTVRNDVFYKEARLHPESAGSALSATSNNGASIGPEVGFGFVMGTFHDEQVLLIKTAQGNRSLGFDFRPPSSGRTDPNSQWESLEYKLMVKGVRETLDKIDKIVPGYKGQGYEIAGFGWFQGHKDSGAPKEEYEKHLVNLINDLRKEFKAPKMPAVVATVGFNGYRLGDGPWKGVWAAQMAVGDTKQHPEFAGTVTSVDTRDFWREVEESPRGQDYHYNRNPETYLLVGEAMGRAMVRMLGGEAVAIPKSDREARTAARVAAEAAKPAPTAEQKTASLAAIKPMILDGALAAYVSNPRYQPSLQAALKGEKPTKVSPYLGDALDEAADYYRAAGIQEYDWKPFGVDLNVASWDYFSFDLPDPQAKKKGISDLKMTCPVGMENWFAPDFDAKKAGWKSGEAPFGVENDPVKYPEWYKGGKRSAPKTGCKGDVLLLRQSIDVPPLKEGYRYRIRVGGSAHANSGEGYAIYVNGKLLAESKAGVVAWRRESNKPRGGHVWASFRDEFKGGKVTIAVSNFPMNNRTDDRFIPARAPLSVWLEEMKIPPLGPSTKAAQ